jgi:ABC-type oligopeptide transport system ATPase subunit
VRRAGSALDVSIQAQILNLMEEPAKRAGADLHLYFPRFVGNSTIFSDDIAVMYLARWWKKAPARELFSHPLHPYTRALLDVGCPGTAAAQRADAN